MSSLSVRIQLDGEYISNIMYRNADMTLYALMELVELLDEVDWDAASATENPKWGLAESVNHKILLHLDKKPEGTEEGAMYATGGVQGRENRELVDELYPDYADKTRNDKQNHLVNPTFGILSIEKSWIKYTDAVSSSSVSIMLRSSSDGDTLNLAGTTVDIRGVCDEFTPEDRKDYEDLGDTPPNEILEGWVYEQLSTLTPEDTKHLLDDVRNQPCNIMLIRDAAGREYESVKAR
jgi:hypothetical protein